MLKARQKAQPTKKPEVEPPRDWVMSVMDTLRLFGGKCSDNCGHFDHRGRPRDRLR